MTHTVNQSSNQSLVNHHRKQLDPLILLPNPNDAAGLWVNCCDEIDLPSNEQSNQRVTSTNDSASLLQGVVGSVEAQWATNEPVITSPLVIMDGPVTVTGDILYQPSNDSATVSIGDSLARMHDRITAVEMVSVTYPEMADLNQPLITMHHRRGGVEGRNIVELLRNPFYDNVDLLEVVESTIDKSEIIEQELSHISASHTSLQDQVRMLQSQINTLLESHNG